MTSPKPQTEMWRGILVRACRVRVDGICRLLARVGLGCACLLPHLAALDEPGVAEVVDQARRLDATQEAIPRVPDDMRAAWYTLGLMARARYVEELATEQEKAALKAARQTYEEAKREHLEKGQAYWLSPADAGGGERTREEYLQQAGPLEERRNQASAALDELYDTTLARIARHYRLLFIKAVDRQVERRRLSPGAASLAKLAYLHLEAHLAGGKLGGATGKPLVDQARVTLADTGRGLAASENNGSLTPALRAGAVNAMQAALADLYLETGDGPYTASIPGGESITIEVSLFGETGSAWGALAEGLSDEALQVLLRKSTLEAAALLADLAVGMDAEWGALR